jgi:hypothetical protein
MSQAVGGGDRLQGAAAGCPEIDDELHSALGLVHQPAQRRMSRRGTWRMLLTS